MVGVGGLAKAIVGLPPDFLLAALDKAACAPFFQERRMKLVEPTNLYRKSGMRGTRGFWKVESSRMEGEGMAF